jgi:PUA-domain protein
MSLKIKNRYLLKIKDIKKIIGDLEKTFNEFFPLEKSSIETGEVDKQKVILVDNTVCFLFYNDKIVFTLYGINKFKPKKNFVVVDMGAIKFLVNGADVMVPGIVDADKAIKEKDQVWICDEKNKKPLAVGIALISGEQMIKDSKGKAIKIIHYVGDALWSSVAKSL